MNRREESQSRRRESRSSTRKVSSLSADQLERKRRNDRDSQRANRQKKQQRLDELEREGNELRAQVAEMQVQGEHFRRHTATLEAEIRRLRHELAIHTGQPEVHGIEESSSAYQSGMYLGNDSGPQYVPRARSAIPTSSQGDRSSQGSEWPSQSASRSASLGQTSDPGYPPRMNHYTAGIQQQGRSQMGVRPMQAGSASGNFGSTVSGLIDPESQQASALPPYQNVPTATSNTYITDYHSGQPYPLAAPSYGGPLPPAQGRLPYPPAQWPSQAYEDSRRRDQG